MGDVRDLQDSRRRWKITKVIHRPPKIAVDVRPRYDATEKWKIETNWSELAAKLVDPDDCDSVLVGTLFEYIHGKDWAPKPTGECVKANANTAA